MRNMKTLTSVVALIIVAVLGGRESGLFDQATAVAPSISGSAVAEANDDLRTAFQNRVSDLQITGSGRVAKVLADDNKGSRHQRFLLRTDSGQTVLVAHNIDLASRIDGLQVGDEVEFNGEYEWNEKGGVIHWTHRDPRGRHEAGWLRHMGRTYD
ncbi:MAG: DUF3465 domain-containing protein [Gammaproteobacteria bacterium]|nr:DUF3465 domain-containing protein [Gammaproteobacteria bacterium]